MMISPGSVEVRESLSKRLPYDYYYHYLSSTWCKKRRYKNQSYLTIV